MSTKTTFKRISLVTVAALGFGVLSSVAPANAAASIVASFIETRGAAVVANEDTGAAGFSVASTGTEIAGASFATTTKDAFIKVIPNAELIATGANLRAEFTLKPSFTAASTATAIGVAAGVVVVGATSTAIPSGFATTYNQALYVNNAHVDDQGAATNGFAAYALGTSAANEAAAGVKILIAAASIATAGAHQVRVYADLDGSGTYTAGDLATTVDFTVGGAMTTDAVSLSKSSAIVGETITVSISSTDGTYGTYPTIAAATTVGMFATCSVGTLNAGTGAITAIPVSANGSATAVCVVATAGTVSTATANTTLLGAKALTIRTAVTDATTITSVASTNTSGIAYSGLYGAITTASIAADTLRTSTLTVDPSVTTLNFVVANTAAQATKYNAYKVTGSNTTSVAVDAAYKSAYIGVDGVSTTISITNAVPVAGDSYTFVVYSDAGTTAWATYTVVYAKAKPKLSIKAPTDNPKIVVGSSAGTFKVKVTDIFGAILASQPVTVSVSGRNTIATTLTSDATGYVTYSYTDAGTTALTLSDTVSFNATNASGSATAATRTITYIATAIAVGTVSISASATTATVDNVQSDAAFGYATGAALITLKSTVRLATGAASGTGVLVTFAGDANTMFIDDVNTSVTDANGEATMIVYRNLVGTSTFTATAGGVTSATTSGTKWSNTDSTDARYVTLTSDPATAMSQGVIRVTAKVTDRWGNPVNAVTLALTEEGAGRLYAGVAATGTTTSTGTYSWDLTSLAGETGTNVASVLVTQAGTQISNLAGYVVAAKVTGVTAGTKSASTTVTFTKDSSTSTADALLALATALGTRDQASATVDAAAEATDAANAATDAANAAAEAADAATAAAQDASDAVAALSAQVSEAIAGLKKQLVSLTNLVIKIQKKVKA